MSLILILALANIPVYLFIGWLVFDSKGNATDTFADTIFAIIKILLVPRIVRVLLGMDDEDAAGIFPILAFFFACGGIVYGEYYLLQKYWH